MKLLYFSLTPIVIGLSLACSPIAHAGEVIYAGPNGGTIKSTVNRQRTGDGYNIQRNTTYPNGKTSASNGEFITDGNGGYSGFIERTNRQGETRLYQIEGQREKGNGSYSNNATITGPNGQQTTVNGSGTYANGQFSGQRDVIYPSGKMRSVAIEGQKTAPGSYSGTRRVTGVNGKTRGGRFQYNRAK